MALAIDTRRVRDVTIVTCAGRIGEGNECKLLQQHLEQVLPREARVILDFFALESIDSSGLGLLVRWLRRTQTLGGTLKLCAVPPRIRDILRVTRLAPLFEMFESEAETLAAFARPVVPLPRSGVGTDVLCIHGSANVLSFLAEAFTQAGYRATTTDDVAQALMMLQAARPKVVIVGAAVRTARAPGATAQLNRLLDERAFIELPETFSADNPDAAGAALFAEVDRLMTARR
jgi:anti-sigma B factor antagonist